MCCTSADMLSTWVGTVGNGITPYGCSSSSVLYARCVPSAGLRPSLSCIGVYQPSRRCLQGHASWRRRIERGLGVLRRTARGRARTVRKLERQGQGRGRALPHRSSGGLGGAHLQYDAAAPLNRAGRRTGAAAGNMTCESPKPTSLNKPPPPGVLHRRLCVSACCPQTGLWTGRSYRTDRSAWSRCMPARQGTFRPNWRCSTLTASCGAGWPPSAGSSAPPSQP